MSLDFLTEKFLIRNRNFERPVIVTGAGSAFSAGGDFSLVEENAATFENRARVFHEARDLVYNIINCKFITNCSIIHSNRCINSSCSSTTNSNR